MASMLLIIGATDCEDEPQQLQLCIVYCRPKHCPYRYFLRQGSSPAPAKVASCPSLGINVTATVSRRHLGESVMRRLLLLTVSARRLIDQYRETVSLHLADCFSRTSPSSPNRSKGNRSTMLSVHIA